MKFVLVDWSWAYRTKWFIASLSRDLVWAYVVWVLLHVNVWRQYVNPMPFCVKSSNLPDWIKKVWQYFTVVPDFKSVGVRDNARSFDWPVIIRAVNTVDAMTATIEPIDWPILMKITDRILKEVKNVNRVCYDMSPKPNATIEWE